jgi:(p)ppGpp synthase/HD superfamily hydrolase
MRTKNIRLSPDEVLDILKEHFHVKDARVHSLYGFGGLSWEGLDLSIYDKKDIVKMALEAATMAHESINQTRKYTGEKYITHPIAVKEIVASVTDDPKMLAAALLHDVIEDVYPKNKAYSLEWVYEKFGERVCKLVRELTNEFTKEKYPDLNRAARKSLENKRISSISPDAKTIKLADIIHNCGSDQGGDDGFQKKYKREKLDQLSFLKEGNNILFNKAVRLLSQ